MRLGMEARNQATRGPRTHLYGFIGLQIHLGFFVEVGRYAPLHWTSARFHRTSNPRPLAGMPLTHLQDVKGPGVRAVDGLG